MVPVQTIRQTIRFRPDVEIVFSRTLRAEVLLKFRIQFRAKFDAGWRNVVRYDHAHGPVHRHQCWLPGEPASDIGPFTTLEEALEWCLADLEENGPGDLALAKLSYTRTGHVVDGDGDA